MKYFAMLFAIMVVVGIFILTIPYSAKYNWVKSNTSSYQKLAYATPDLDLKLEYLRKINEWYIAQQLQNKHAAILRMNYRSDNYVGSFMAQIDGCILTIEESKGMLGKSMSLTDFNVVQPERYNTIMNGISRLDLHADSLTNAIFPGLFLSGLLYLVLGFVGLIIVWFILDH